MPGGFSAPKPATEKEQLILDAVKPQLSERFHCDFTNARAVSYISQVVAGTIYIMKIQNSVVPCKIFTM